jgi:hypothetical protein
LRALIFPACRDTDPALVAGFVFLELHFSKKRGAGLRRVKTNPELICLIREETRFSRATREGKSRVQVAAPATRDKTARGRRREPADETKQPSRPVSDADPIEELVRIVGESDASDARASCHVVRAPPCGRVCRDGSAS